MIALLNFHAFNPDFHIFHKSSQAQMTELMSQLYFFFF